MDRRLQVGRVVLYPEGTRDGAVAPGEPHRRKRRFSESAGTPLRGGSISKPRACMAESTAVALAAASIPSSAEITRAEKLVRERFLHEGEDAAVALAPGSPRRRALDRRWLRWTKAPSIPRPPGGATSRCCSASSGCSPRTSQARRRHGPLRPPGRCAVGHAHRAAGRGAALCAAATVAPPPRPRPSCSRRPRSSGPTSGASSADASPAGGADAPATGEHGNEEDEPDDTRRTPMAGQATRTTRTRTTRISDRSQRAAPDEDDDEDDDFDEAIEIEPEPDAEEPEEPRRSPRRSPATG